MRCSVDEMAKAMGNEMVFPGDSLLGELPVGVAVLQEDGTVTYHNRKMEELLKVPAGSLLGENIFSCRAMKKAREGITLSELTSGEKVMEVTEYVEGEGVSATFIIGMRPLGGGRLVMVLQRHKGEEELSRLIRESRDRFKTIVDTLEDGIVAFDRSMKIILCNFPFSTSFGKDPRDVVGRQLDEILAAEDLEEENAYIEEVFTSGVAVQKRLARQVGSGMRYYFTRYIPRHSPAGEVDSILRIAVDQTNRIVAERDLIRAKEYIDNLISSSTDIIYSTDLSGGITVWNRAAEEIYGKSGEEVTGVSVEKVISQGWGSHSFNDLKRKVLKEERMVIDVERKIGGNLSSFLCTISPVMDQKEGVIAISFIEKDITDIKVLHEELKEKNRELEKLIEDVKERESQLIQSEKMASIGQLAAGMAHEINNPIGFIKSNLQTFSDYAEDLSTYIHEALEAVHEGGGKEKNIAKSAKEMNISFIIDDLKSLVSESMEGVQRIQHIVQNVKTFAHKGEGEKEKVELSNVLDGACTLAWNEIKYKAKVEKEFQEGLEIDCYPIQLGQVVLNLLVNAAQAIEGKDGKIRIATRKEGDMAVIEVSDNGSGMSEEVRKRIFEPFYTTKAVGKGTGLGLSIAYSIVVEKHMGEINVHSVLGEGTTFTMKLPIRDGGE